MKCTSCGREVSASAPRCPACGAPTPPTPEREFEAAVRSAAHEVGQATRVVVREAKPIVKKAVEVTKGAVRGAIQGARDASGPSSAPAPGMPPPPPPPGATGDVKPRKTSGPNDPPSS